MSASFEQPELTKRSPALNINAGFALSGIQGSASISSGITAKVPNSARAKLDLLNENKAEVSGWTPTVTTKPIHLNAEVDGTLELYTELSLDVNFEVLKYGLGLGVALKVPDVNFKLEAAYENQGGVFKRWRHFRSNNYGRYWRRSKCWRIRNTGRLNVDTLWHRFV